MSETFSALARALPTEQDEIKALIEARPEFSKLVSRFETLEREAAKLLDEIYEHLSEAEEEADDRGTV
jgi:hypothetical protein